jgi:hypothetical protein
MAEPRSPGPEPAGWIVNAPVTTPWFFPDEHMAVSEGLLDAPGLQAFRAPERHRHAQTLAPQCFLGRPRLYRGQAAALLLETRSRINPAAALSQFAP